MAWIQFYPGLGVRPWPRPENTEARIEWAWAKYQIQLDQLRKLDDDALPFFDMYSGTELFAEAFGCKVHLPDNDMPFALPLVRSAKEASRLSVPGLDAPPLKRVFHIARELRRRSDGQALFRLPDIQSPMDIAALVWEKTTFYTALLEEGEAVQELAAKIRSLLVAFLEQWFTEFGADFIAHYPDYYMPRGITLSEDEVGAVSGEVFLRHFLPELSLLSQHFGGMGMHCCANSFHQWENFKKVPGLRLININQPQAVTKKAYHFFAGHTAQLHINAEAPGWTPPEQIPPGSKVVYNIPTDDPGIAADLLRRIRSQ